MVPTCALCCNAGKNDGDMVAQNVTKDPDRLVGCQEAEPWSKDLYTHVPLGRAAEVCNLDHSTMMRAPDAIAASESIGLN